MIKANELRIGNLVADRGGKILTIDRFYGNKIECDVKGMPEKDLYTGIRLYYHPFTEEVEYLKPIPLTPELLERAGFEKRESSTCTEWYFGENEITHDWLFSLTWLENPELIKAPNAPFYRNGRHTIYYVHQLQNLYFALTGQELEFKNV